MKRMFGFGACLLALCSACSEPAQELPTFKHYSALSDGLRETEALVAARAAEVPESDASIDPEQILGLVITLANSNGRTRDLPLEEITTLGDGASPLLAVIAANTEQGAAERIAACELLAKLGTPRATEHLLQLCEKAPEGWLRSQAAWRLSEIDADWAVPRLVFRLKYEYDEEAAIWIASTLGALGNYSGLEALWNLRNNSSQESIRNSAQERLTSLAESVGAASPEEHWELWNGTDPERKLWRAKPSARLQLAVWRQVEQLSGEHFQLRGVDDARFILSRMGSWVTTPLAAALHDEDVYVRVHVAQCLERMGPRANVAGPALVEALADPTLAGAAAAALGSVAYPAAEPILRRRLLDPMTEHELRVACAASLGNIGLAASIPDLDQLVQSDEPFDLRQACALALVRMNAGARAASFLLGALSEEAADRPGAEAALENWLVQLDSDVARETLQEWHALNVSAGDIPTTAEADARMAARRDLLLRKRAQLKGL